MKPITAEDGTSLMCFRLPSGNECSFLTVAIYPKWYCLYVVHHTGEVEEIPFTDLEQFCPKGEIPFCDHVPNPRAVVNLCYRWAYELDDLVAEMLVGRWEIEVRDNYDMCVELEGEDV